MLTSGESTAPLAFALQETWHTETSPCGWSMVTRTGCTVIKTGEAWRPQRGRQRNGVALVLGPAASKARETGVFRFTHPHWGIYPPALGSLSPCTGEFTRRLWGIYPPALGTGEFTRRLWGIYPPALGNLPPGSGEFTPLHWGIYPPALGNLPACTGEFTPLYWGIYLPALGNNPRLPGGSPPSSRGITPRKSWVLPPDVVPTPLTPLTSTPLCCVLGL